MLLKKSTLLSPILMLAIGCGQNVDSQSKLAGVEPAGGLRGYVEYNNILGYRLGTNNRSADAFKIEIALSGDIYGSLSRLLGAWSGHGAGNRFVNGEPNGINLLLLRLAFSKIAREATKNCVQEADLKQLKLNDQARDTLCALADPHVAVTDDQLEQLWQLVMGWDDLASERDAWMERFRELELTEMNRLSVLTHSLEALLLNPYFLLVSN